MPVREMLITFFVILGIGAFMNGMPKDEDPMRDAIDMQSDGSTSSNPPQKNLLENPLIAVGTEQNFNEEVLSSKRPVLVEFYVDSDPHCNNMAPIISEIATNYQGHLKVVKIDLMTNPSLMKRFDIGQMPGLIIFKNGIKMQALAGEMTSTDLGDFLTRQGIQPSAGTATSG